MLRFILAAALAIVSVSPASAEAPDVKLALPQSGIVKVAFVVPPGTTLIDLAGPMQVLDQAQTPGTAGFQTFTVSETRSPIKAGNLTVTPDYTFADVPDADIIVVGASGSQTGGASGI